MLIRETFKDPSVSSVSFPSQKIAPDMDSFDEDSSQLIDIKNENVSINNLPSAPSGKKIKEIEIIIRVANNNQKQKNY